MAVASHERTLTSPLTGEPVRGAFYGVLGQPYAWVLVCDRDDLRYIVSARWLADSLVVPPSAHDRRQMALCARHFNRRKAILAFIAPSDREAFDEARQVLFPESVEPWYVPE